MGQRRREITITVTVERSGGVAGMRTRAAVADRDLDAENAARLRTLAQALEPSPPDRDSPPSGADRFSYEVVVMIGTDEHRLCGAEGGLPPGWRAIVSFVMAHGRRQLRPL